MAQQEVPRCPLGFTGTPPIGHPTIPGIFGAGKDEKIQSKVEVGSGNSVEVQKKKTMSPYLVLTLDALVSGSDRLLITETERETSRWRV